MIGKKEKWSIMKKVQYVVAKAEWNVVHSIRRRRRPAEFTDHAATRNMLYSKGSKEEEETVLLCGPDVLLDDVVWAMMKMPKPPLSSLAMLVKQGEKRGVGGVELPLVVAPT
jgi:hypothetical protein